MVSDKLPNDLQDAIQKVIPDFDGNSSSFLTAYSFDSFDLLTLRALIEETVGIVYDDQDWMKIKTFGDFERFSKLKDSSRAEKLALSSAELIREYRLNMPQMNIGGLSEYWFLKEIGDMHWSLIASSLAVESDKILDQAGNRLYATFVRIKFESKVPFSSFIENDKLKNTSKLTHFGSFYLSKCGFGNKDKFITTELATSFVARGKGNSELFKSVPIEKNKNNLPTYNEVPAFIETYYEVRKEKTNSFKVDDVELIFGSESIFETRYQLDPYHDLNGVKLLYFAAYPHIYDVCERKFMNMKKRVDDWAMESSIMMRDIYYLGNLDLGDEIIYRLRDHKEVNGAFYFLAELFRASDGKRLSMAIVKKGRSE